MQIARLLAVIKFPICLLSMFEVPDDLENFLITDLTNAWVKECIVFLLFCDKLIVMCAPHSPRLDSGPLRCAEH
jgi:hypothetical protein